MRFFGLGCRSWALGLGSRVALCPKHPNSSFFLAKMEADKGHYKTSVSERGG